MSAADPPPDRHGVDNPATAVRLSIDLRHICQWQADLDCLEAYVVNSILLLLAGPAGGAGGLHGMTVPVWLIVAAVVVIVIVGVVGILRRRR